MRRYLTYVPLVLLVLLLLLAWYGWNHKQELALHFIQPPPPKEVIKLKTVTAECVPVVHYVKAEAEKADMVPEYAKKDPDKQVTAAIDVPPHETETLVTSVFDMKTGINTLSYRQEPVPFWGAGYKEAGIMYGLDDRIIANGRWEPLRIGNGYLKVEGIVDYDLRDSSIEFFFGAGYLRRWK